MNTIARQRGYPPGVKFVVQFANEHGAGSVFAMNTEEVRRLRCMARVTGVTFNVWKIIGRRPK